MKFTKIFFFLSFAFTILFPYAPLSTLSYWSLWAVARSFSLTIPLCVVQKVFLRISSSMVLSMILLCLDKRVLSLVALIVYFLLRGLIIPGQPVVVLLFHMKMNLMKHMFYRAFVCESVEQFAVRRDLAIDLSTS